jgi:hypothetical protein
MTTTCCEQTVCESRLFRRNCLFPRLCQNEKNDKSVDLRNKKSYLIYLTSSEQNTVKRHDHVPPFSGTWPSTLSVAAIVCFTGFAIWKITLWPFLGFGIILLLVSAIFFCVIYVTVAIVIIVTVMSSARVNVARFLTNLCH